MKSTKDYEIFKRAEGNRSINQENLSRIIESLEKVNLLKECPIVVNKEMEILDGQHRLEAAKSLGLEVWYIETDQENFSVMTNLNYAKKAWSIEDWVNYWAGRGRAQYILLQKLSVELNRSCNELHRVCGKRGGRGGNGGMGGGAAAALKNGNLELLQDESLERTIQAIKESNTIIKAVFDASMKKSIFVHTVKFKEALLYFIKRKDVCAQELLEKLILKINVFRPCTTAEAYSEMLMDIYNHGKKNRIAPQEPSADL